MLAFFRRLSKSKIGNWIMAFVLVAILGGFALADLSNFGTGIPGFGMSSTTIAEVGRQDIKQPDVEQAMERHLQQVRQQNPSADYSTILRDLDPLLNQLIDERAISGFAHKYGFTISKRLVDAEIANLPGVKGLNGKPDVQNYQRLLAENRLSDAEVRRSIAASLAGRYMMLPLSAEARVPVGVATPYAQMLLEEREGEAAVVPFTAFTANLKPADADLQRYYTLNRARYVVPEQRTVRFAKITADQVPGATATDQEIDAYYKANQANYASKELRNLTQVVVPDQATANAIAARAKAGQPLAAAAAPAGSKAAISSPKDQTKDAFASAAGNNAANAVFAASSDAVVGPIQSDFGWVVAKVESIRTEGGKSLAAAKAEIATKLNADKRKGALEELTTKIQDAIDGGSNFTEAVAVGKLQVVTTPLVTADGTSRVDASYRLPAEYAPALKAAFGIAPNDEPEVVALPDKSGYVITAPEQVVAAAPAPLASIRERVVADWTMGEGLARAKKAAETIAAKGSQGISLADAIKQLGVALPVQPLKARRIQVAQANPQIAPALATLFSLQTGKAKMVADTQRRGYFVVKVNKALQVNALAALSFVGRMRADIQQQLSDDYTRQFVNAIRADLKVRKNDKAIEEYRKRLASTGG